MSCCPYKKKLGQGHTQQEDHVTHREKQALREPRREASQGLKPADSLTLDLQPPELLFKAPQVARGRSGRQPEQTDGGGPYVYF